MTWSRSSSSSAAALLAALLATGCASGRPARVPLTPDGRALRVAVLPPENLSGGSAPLSEIRRAVEETLASAGVEVVPPADVETYLARHRIRYTGGVDAASAKAAGEELGAAGVLVTSVDLYASDPPALGLGMRLVGATERAELLWTDGAARTADDSPGLLGLGRLTSIAAVERAILPKLARSLVAAASGNGPRAHACTLEGRFTPRTRYRSTLLDPAAQRYSVAVVPFRNLARRRGAGDVVALQFARQLAADEGFAVIEPGVVRESLFRSRVIMEGGVSVDQVRTLLATLEADLVLAGDVLDYADGAGAMPPAVSFTATLFDARTGEIVWQSTSFNTGSQGVWFFGAGRVSSASALACGMTRASADAMSTAAPVRSARRAGTPDTAELR
jgi:hypothetical protein